MEETVVLIKPDGVKRGLVGEILHRFERAGLKIVALKMVWAKGEILEKHYTDKKEYLISLGKKTLANYQQFGRDTGRDLGTRDPYKLGQMIRGWLIDYVSSGPMVAVLLSGQHAVDNVRALAGPTMPVDAPAGTIRGDFSTDSAAYANTQKRGVKNLLHVSGSPEEAEFERKLWFKESDIHDYQRSDIEE